MKYNRNEYLTNTRKSERQKNERKLNQLWNKASHAFDDSWKYETVLVASEFISTLVDTEKLQRIMTVEMELTSAK